MRDLRRQALESGKTVSRKARSKQSSPATSRLASPASSSRAASRSRGHSRQGSDDDGNDDLSDETSFSVGSLDEVLNSEAAEKPSGSWQSSLADTVGEILTRKGSTLQGRESCYKTYIHLLTARYVEEEIRGKEPELVAAFLRSIKEEKSQKETILALKALALTLITSPTGFDYKAVHTPLMHSISESNLSSVKTAAIHTLGACTFWGDASSVSSIQVEENMEFLFDIITSDGDVINAFDEPEPVVAALEEWGFLCTLIDDTSTLSQDAIEAFAEQITSSYPAVKIAAAENIALLYENSYKPVQWDEDSLSLYSKDDLIADPDDDTYKPILIHLYEAYRRTDLLKDSLQSVASINLRQMSRTDRKALHASFTDILNSIENPTHGPRYQTAIDKESGKRYGSRMTVKIHRDGVMKIDQWWKLQRLQGLRRVLQGGFVSHYEKNAVVFETLPIMITTTISLPS